MNSSLLILYDTFVIKSQLSSPDYQAAMAEWRRARGGAGWTWRMRPMPACTPGEKSPFPPGLRMGLELSHDLSGIWMNRS